MMGDRRREEKQQQQRNTRVTSVIALSALGPCTFSPPHGKCPDKRPPKLGKLQMFCEFLKRTTMVPSTAVTVGQRFHCWHRFCFSSLLISLHCLHGAQFLRFFPSLGFGLESLSLFFFPFPIPFLLFPFCLSDFGSTFLFLCLMISIQSGSMFLDVSMMLMVVCHGCGQSTPLIMQHSSLPCLGIFQ